jgi:hypothetical protein
MNYEPSTYLLNNTQIVLISFCFGSLFYLVKTLLKTLSKKFNRWSHNEQIQVISRLVSSVHAILVTVLAVYVLITDSDLYLNKLRLVCN